MLHMLRPHTRLLLLLSFLFVGATCGTRADTCFLADSRIYSAEVDYGKALTLHPQLCEGVRPHSVDFAWSHQGMIVGRESTHEFLACPRYRDTVQQIRVEMEAGGQKAAQGWRIAVRDVEPDYPRCSPSFTVEEAIEAVQTGDYRGERSGVDFKTASACLEQVIREYPCDTRVVFWKTFADLFLLLERAPLQLLVSGQSEDTLNSYIDDRIEPLIRKFEFLAQETLPDFKARVEPFDFHFMGIPHFWMDPGGIWDRGDILVLAGGLQLLKGGAKFISAYQGAIEFFVMTVQHGVLDPRRPNRFKLPEAYQNRLIEMLEADPSYLTLYPGGDGEARLAASRQALIRGLDRVNAAITRVKSETDDQRDHIFRYFDCGEDGICPPDQSRDPIRGDPGEPLVRDLKGDGIYDPATDVYVDVNMNGRYDPPWWITGPDPGENDGQYNDGETIGTDVFHGDVGRLGIGIPPLMQELIDDLARNIQGPDALDITRYAGLNQSMPLQFARLGGVNIPEIRLSRWFENPRDLRDFFPLWSRGKKLFITDSEEERWLDYGLDGIPDEEEDAENPRCPDRIPESLNVIDPAGDNYMPMSNPNDNCDNNLDTVVDGTDGAGRSVDFGTEGNDLFDFIDRNQNFVHDTCPEAYRQFFSDGSIRCNCPADPAVDMSCEPSERWFDEGVWTAFRDGEHTKRVGGAGNHRWDAIDIEHIWPQGADVGGRRVDITRDPRNSTLQESISPALRVIDPVYYFFPDAQFNGVVVFAEPTVNADGEMLTHNAELMRLISLYTRFEREQRRPQYAPNTPWPFGE
jgi:hypothetical protein